MARLRTNGFTLIEMLMVIVIVGIILGLTIPAVTSLMKSGGVSSAARHITNQLGLARQYAITHRVNTRVVFPFRGTTPASSQAPNYLSYAVVANVTNTWAYIGKWEQLPLGVIFLKVTPANGGALDNLKKASMPFPNSAGAATLAYIEFNPAGTATQMGTLTYQEGLIDGFGNPQTTSSNSATNVVDNLIGRIQLLRP